MGHHAAPKSGGHKTSAVASPQPIAVSPGAGIGPETRRPAWGARALGVGREHALFCVVLLVAAVVRAVAILGYPPALWYPDSLGYVQTAVFPIPNPERSSGYSFFLMLLSPFHSFATVTVLQHLMGLAIGTLVYALLRSRYGLPGWAATLAAAPALLSAYAIQLEHFVLSDTIFGLLVTAALVLTLWHPVPRLWTSTLAGLLLGAAALDRGQGLLLVLPFMAFLLIRPSRRAVAAALAICVSFAIPLLAYAGWYDDAHGSFELTSSTGAFLYARVAGFSECSAIKPPSDERFLCISTPISERAILQRSAASYYIWNYNSPINHGPPGAAFSGRVNSLATNFAERAIIAQPLDYLKVVWDATLQNFSLPGSTTWQNQSVYFFPAAPESLKALANSIGSSEYKASSIYGGGDTTMRLKQPFAGWMRIYQRFIVVPGPLLGLIALAGLIGVAAAWRRRGGPALLAWLTGMVLIIVPAATADYDARYTVAAVPAFCIAAAIGLRDISAGRAGRDVPPE
jgi:hypothetical protein